MYYPILQGYFTFRPYHQSLTTVHRSRANRSRHRPCFPWSSSPRDFRQDRVLHGHPPSHCYLEWSPRYQVRRHFRQWGIFFQSRFRTFAVNYNLIIQAHICVLQSALSLLNPPPPLKPYVPYIVADGVSSCNQWEVPIALDRLRQEGAIVTTSESLAFQLIGSASHSQFKAFSQLIREQKDSTTLVGDALLLGKDGMTKL